MVLFLFILDTAHSASWVPYGPYYLSSLINLCSVIFMLWDYVCVSNSVTKFFLSLTTSNAGSPITQIPTPFVVSHASMPIRVPIANKPSDSWRLAVTFHTLCNGNGCNLHSDLPGLSVTIFPPFIPALRHSMAYNAMQYIPFNGQQDYFWYHYGYFHTCLHCWDGCRGWGYCHIFVRLPFILDLGCQTKAVYIAR